MGNRIPLETILTKINNKCEKLNYTFLGFVGDYHSTAKTKIVLKCNKHEVTWDTTLVDTFIRTDTKGCLTCKREGASERNSLLWIGNTRYYRGNLQTIVEERGKHIMYHCDTCSPDTELYPSSFKLHKSDWVSGRCSCGCSKSMRRTSEQYNVLCSRKADTLPDISFIGFTEEKVTVSSNIILSCKYHGEWSTSSVEKFLSKDPRGCPSCAKENNTKGLYYRKVEEIDNLYLLLFKDKSSKESFLKIGRSFDVKRRISAFPDNYQITLLDRVEDKHENIFNIENMLHNSLESYRIKPKLPFGGSIIECYSKDILKDELIKSIFSIRGNNES